MHQKQEENESEADKDLQPDAWEDPLHRLSARAQAVLHAVTAWAHQLPAGTVDVTYTLFPLEDDYGSELLITLQPHTPCWWRAHNWCDLGHGVPVPFSSGGDERNRSRRRPHAFARCPYSFTALLEPPRRGLARGRGRSLLRGGHRADPTYDRHPQGEGVGS